jgi:hypothetical protein
MHLTHPRIHWRLIGRFIRPYCRLGFLSLLLMGWFVSVTAQTQDPSAARPKDPPPPAVISAPSNHVPNEQTIAVQAKKKTPIPVSVIEKQPESAAVPQANRPSGTQVDPAPPIYQPTPTPYFYYGPEGPEYFTLSRKQALAKFKPGLSHAQIAQLLSQEAGILPISAEQILPAPQVVLLELAPNLSESAILELLERLNDEDQVIYANPFLMYHDGTPQGIMDRLTVGLTPGGTLADLQQFAAAYQVEVEQEDEFMPGIFHLRVLPQANGNALDMARIFHESGLFQFAEPDFLLRLQTQTNDQFYDYQWSIENTGSAIQYSGTVDADMDVDLAWATTTGSASISVAILDEGVDLTHPDLVGNMLAGYDATGLGSGGAPSGDDAHGTACAGIVAATADNTIGVAGVAYSCKIVPVRIAYSNGGSWVTSNTWISNSINWAWNTGGADVLSNSWGGGSSSSLINTAITSARTSGRGGLGCPVLFSAGNGNGAVNYPANNNETIAVAAMSMCNERKSPSSCDGETWWGSDYGTNLDIAAPGVKIYTTDISGADGYNGGDYAPTFNGTSSACPNAAGVMALILSYDPTLTETQARNTIESTCTKVGGYTYTANVPGQPNGTWSNDLGYGCVNALNALNALSGGGGSGNGDVFAYRAYSPGGDPTGPVSFDLTAPGTLYLIADQSAQNFLSAGAWANDTWYAADFFTDELVSVDTANGGRTVIGALGAHVDGMTWDPSTNTMYGIDFTGSFYTINLTTGAATAVNTASGAGFINLASDASGVIYTMNINSDSLYTVNKVSGAISPVGPLGIDISFAQDLEFDPNTGTLYMAAYNVGLAVDAGELRIVDPSTGSSTLVGEFEGKAEITAMAIPQTAVQPPALNDPVFGYRAFSPGGDPTGPITFELSTPGSLYLLQDQSAQNFPGAGAWANDTWYGADFFTDELVTIDTASGNRSVVGPIGFHLDGMSWDPSSNTMYGINADGSLYTVNPNTGAGTLVAAGLGQDVFINLASDASGQLYTMGLNSDSLYTVNSSTGAISAIGPLGIDITFAQDLEFDLSDGTLYMAAYNTGLPVDAGELRTVNTSTGATTLIGEFEGQAEVTAFAIPGTAPVNPIAGGVFGYRAYVPGNVAPLGPVAFDLTNPGSLYLIADQSAQNFLGSGSWANGMWYATDFFTDELYTVDTLTGARTLIGPMNAHMDGMTYDGTTMYGINFDGSLYSIDLATGAASLIGGGGGTGFINLAADASGLLYSTNITDDFLYSINPLTGAATQVGALGIDITFAQDMEFNPADGQMYWTCYNTGGATDQGELRIIDPGTGSSTLIGVFQDLAEITAFAIPGTASNPSPFPPVVPTNTFATFLGQAQVEGIPADPNDIIAAFDDNGNIAGSASLIMNAGIAYINLTIYGDDALTPGFDEGMNPGEDFTLRLWDASANEVLWYPTIGNPTYFSGWVNTNGLPLPGYDDPNDIYNFRRTTLDTIPLTAGWNLISTDVVPADSTPAAVFANLNPGNLVFVTGFDGGSLIYDPNGLPFLNTLTHLESRFGYWVRVLADDTLYVEGDAIDETFKKDLDAGWNLMGYIPQAPETPANYFSSLINNTNLVFVTGFDQGTQVFDPYGLPFLNTLTELRNSFGFWVRVNSAAGGGTYRVSKTEFGQEKTPAYHFFNGTSNLGSEAVGQRVFLETLSGERVGAMTVLKDGYLMTTVIYGDDPLTPEVEGLLEEEPLRFVYQNQALDPGVRFRGNMDLTTVDLHFEKQSLIGIYPNPFQATVHLSYELDQKATVRVKVLNAQGQLVSELIHAPQQATRHELQWDASDHPQGVYFLQLELDGELTETHRIVHLK